MLMPSRVSLRCNFASTIKRGLCVHLINAMFELHFLRTSRTRLIILARTVEAEQLGLHGERKVTFCSFDESEPFFSRQSGHFFSAM